MTPTTTNMNLISLLSFKLIQCTIRKYFSNERVVEIIRLLILASHMFVCASVMDVALKLTRISFSKDFKCLKTCQTGFCKKQLK